MRLGKSQFQVECDDLNKRVFRETFLKLLKDVITETSKSIKKLETYYNDILLDKTNEKHTEAQDLDAVKLISTFIAPYLSKLLPNGKLSIIS